LLEGSTPVPKPFPAEFRADVIAVARKGEAPLRQIAKDFGISEACLHRWLKIADREDGVDRAGSPVGQTGNLNPPVTPAFRDTTLR
jgi:transposase-like protein